MFCRFNEADTDDLLTNFVSLNDLWDNSLARLVERAGSADPAWLTRHPEIAEEY